MGYYIQAIVGSQTTILPLVNSRNSARMVELHKGLSMILMTEELYDEVNQTDVARFDNPAFNRFLRLSPRVIEWIVTASYRNSVAYLEAEFFGGKGSQSSVVWERGQIIHGPEHSRWAINKALRHLGITSRMNELMRSVGIYKHLFKDEFDLVGLGQCRHTKDWLKLSG
jgi:hypothetical protein